MNDDWDIHTPAGLEKAQAWMRGLIGMVSNDAVWGIPRNMTIYRIDKTNNVFHRESGPGDPAVEHVVMTMGYGVEFEARTEGMIHG